MPEMRSSVDLAWNAARHAYIGKGRPGMAGSWNITAEATRNGAVIATFRTRLTAQ